LVASTVGVGLSAQSDRSKGKAKQTHDRGVDDAVPVAQDRIGERDTAGLTILSRPDGTLVAQLDESFHDAVVAVKNADGTTSYTCLHGLPAADGQVKAHKPAATMPSTPTPEEK
jgi:hypothetical protein